MPKNKVLERFVKAYGVLPTVVGVAPGRIEFIGNHTDYNGGLVMGVALDKKIAVALKKRSDRKLCFYKASSDEKVVIDMDNIAPQEKSLNWVNYPLGVFKFIQELGLKADCGFNFADFSNLPTGAGLSSSAAIEMATAMALAKLYDFEIEKVQAVNIGRKSENEFVGMPCGILDQGVSVFGKENSIVFIDCESLEFSTCPLPETCRFVLFNSTKKHALVDGLYAARHNECMEASRVLSGDKDAKLLRAFTLEDLENAKGKMSEKAYMRAKHVIAENGRVAKVSELLKAGDISGVGKQLFASHESSKTLFENSCEELDLLVDLLKQNKNVYGARLSGGGFGGAVMALVNSDFDELQANEIAQKYAQTFGELPRIIECKAGDGAEGFKL